MTSFPLHGERLDLGLNSCAWLPCHIGTNTTFKSNCSVGALSHIGRDVMIGNNVRIQGGCYIADRTLIEDDVFIGPCAVTLNDKYPPSNNADLWQPVTLERGCVIGGNATILPGVRVGKNAVVAAGSTVTKDIPEHQVWAGTPAKFLMGREEYESRRDND